ncbi:hypothetical protein JHK86_045830 [Glycine max]|nr:hypothetical protein JHK86_045830 [Glycine max]
MLEFNAFHFHLTHIIFSLIFNLSKAQSSMEPVPAYITHHSWEPSVAITVAAIIFALLLMAIISVYLRRCAQSHIIITTTTLPCSCSQGINKDLLNTFPTLFYSNIKDLNKANQTLECAVCLTDFTHKDSLRLLPKCNHVFHPHCIDSWLTSHVTCPVCRANLSQESSCHVSITVPPHGEEGSLGNMTTTTTEATQVEQRPSNDINQDCVGDPTSTSDITKIIYISEEQHSSSELASEVELGSKTNVRNSTITNIGDGVVASERNLSRSNSTGHSLVEEQGKGVERYTLRLPEDVRRYILVNHGRSVQRSASVKGGCWSDSEESYVGKRVEKRWVICTPPFVAQHG